MSDAPTASSARLCIDPSNANYFRYGGRTHWLVGHSRLWTLSGWMPRIRDVDPNAEADSGRHRSPDARDYRDEIDEMAAAGVTLARMTPFWPGAWRDGRPMPWVELEPGRFDLTRFEPWFFEHLAAFLDRCAAAAIIVQLELWDRPGLSHFHPSRWPSHPFNPDFNVNYDDRVLPGGESNDIVFNGARFYRAIDGGNPTLLDLQHRYIEKLLEVAGARPNVIYCIENEGVGGMAWEAYWSRFVRQRVSDALVTAMPLDAMDNTWRSYFSDDFQCMDGGGTGLRYAMLDLVGGHAGFPRANPAPGRADAYGGEERFFFDRIALVRETMSKYRQHFDLHPQATRPIYVSNGFGRVIDNPWAMLCCGAAGFRFHRNTWEESGCSYRWVKAVSTFLRDAQPDLPRMQPAHDRLGRGVHGVCLAGESEAIVYVVDRGRPMLSMPVGEGDAGRDDVIFAVRRFDPDAGVWLDEKRIAASACERSAAIDGLASVDAVRVPLEGRAEGRTVIHVRRC